MSTAQIKKKILNVIYSITVEDRNFIPKKFQVKDLVKDYIKEEEEEEEEKESGKKKEKQRKYN